jgi:chromate transport protein ChrA
MMIGLFQASYNWTAIVSILFTILPLILGLAVLRIVRAENWESMQSRRISLVVIGIIAPFAWTGLYLGPIMVIAAGLVPLFK